MNTMKRHQHEPFANPIIVSGYGMTEYEINFCKVCGIVLWELTKDFDNLYPDIFGKEKP